MRSNSAVKIQGWKWLREHPKCEGIRSWVLAPEGELFTPAWMKNDKNFFRMQKDRLIVQLRKNDHSVRHSAHRAGCSYQHVLDTVTVYEEFSTSLFEPDVRLDLRSRARTVLTREVIARFDAGELDMNAVCALLHPQCTRQHAKYWVKKLRALYAKRSELGELGEETSLVED